MTAKQPVDPPAAGNGEETAYLADAMLAEAEAVRRVAARATGEDADHWHRAIDLLTACGGHVVVSGMGKSGLIGAKIAATMSSLGQPAHFLHPSEAVHGDLGRVRPGDVAILMSYSGSTEEVVNLAAILRADRVPVVGISAKHGSHLARLSDVHLAIGDVVEACPLNLAPTASTTAMLAMGDALALAVSRRRNFAADDFHRRHPGGLLGAGLKNITEVLRFRVGDNVATVTEETTVAAALSQAGQNRRAGALVVVDGQGRLSGIFTDGDLRRSTLSGGAGFLTAPVGGFMTRGGKTVPAEALAVDALKIFQQFKISDLFALDAKSRPIGYIDVQDLPKLKIL